MTVAVYAPALFLGRVLLPADIVPLMRPWAATAAERFPDRRVAQNQMHGPIFEYYSWRSYARGRILAGEVPLWNPNELSGNVLLANSQSAVLYPPNVLLYLFSLPTGINLVTALHTFLTGLMMLGFLRTLGLRRAAAMTGALAWMFCGTLTVWMEFQTPTATLCWLPGLLWCWELYAQGRGWRWALLGGGAGIALALLAGHLQFAFYVVLAFALYALGRTLQMAWRRSHADAEDGAPPGRWTSGLWRPLAVLVGALVLGTGLSMSTTLPVVEMGRMNFRAARPDYAASVALRIPPVQLLQMVAPNLFGNPRDYVSTDAQGALISGRNYWGRFEYVEYTAYMGIPALILALVGLAALAAPLLALRKRDRSPVSPHPSSLVLALLGLLGLLLALGTPLCALFVYGVPGYRQFNATARALCLVSFALAAFAAFGLDWLLRAREAGRGRVALVMLSASAGVVALACVVAFPVALILATHSPAVLGDLAPYPDVYAKWEPYELAGLRNGLLFAALTVIFAWLALRRSSTPSAALAWLLPAAAAADLLVWAAGFNPMPPREMLGYPTATTDFLKGTSPARVVSLEAQNGEGIKTFIVPNYNLVVGYREAQGADSLHTRRYHQLMERVALAMAGGREPAFADPNTLHFRSLAHPVFGLLDVRYATTMPDAPPPGPGFRPATDAELRVWENPARPGPVWVVGAAETVKGVDDAFMRLSAPDFDGRRTALLEHEPPALDAAAAGSPAALVSFAPHRLEADVDARGRGLAVFSEIAFPGWRARVDGRPAPVYTADYVLRAVPVPPGRHRVSMAYDPASWRVGLYLTLLAALSGAALLVVRRRA